MSDNIDNLLMSSITGIPAPEVIPNEIPTETVDSTYSDTTTIDSEVEDKNPIEDSNVVDISTAKPILDEKTSKDVINIPEKDNLHTDFDDYGNEKPKSVPKSYTEEEVNARINEAVRERLARLERNNPGQLQQPVIQPSAQPTYDANNPEDWQKQLEDFTFKAIEKREQQQVAQRQQAQEQQAQREFEDRFHNGMSKFGDFQSVVGSQPITNAMTIATRAMKDPASFLYAASKRHAPELQRISQISDPYTQMVEIGRLEERMKKMQGGTTAPRPIRPFREDVTIEEPEQRAPSIDDMIAFAENDRLSKMRGRR